MTYDLNSKQIEAVTSLSDAKRFDHFIARIVDWEEVWSLKAESGWATVESENRLCIPFWPHVKYAESFAKGDWNGYIAEAITLADFIGKWLPGMEKDNTFAGIFPNKEMRGVVLEPNRVLLAINEEIEQY
jgi:hypothetical protein